MIVDPTVSEHPAVARGAQLAQAFKARLELYACETKASREARLAAHVRKHSKEPFVVDLKAMLESLAAPLRAEGVDVATETECADPLHVALLDRAKRTSAELVIKDTHHHTLAQRTLFTNTDWQLIRGCPVPLLLVKPGPWASSPKVVAAIDPGHANDKPAMLDHCILQHASAFSKVVNGELHVLHAYIPPAVLAAAASVPPMAMTVSAEELAREEESKRKEIAALVSDYGVRSGNIHVSTGGTVNVLPRAAEAIKADVMVLGAVSRSGLKRVFIGSTAEDVLEKLPCDALIIKPPDFASMLPF
ncbi:MAG TPA: universal stress protein [Steroidobacteraceae bacterium]|nr:universal stress protein [Steroidobacteraceae bacterium]